MALPGSQSVTGVRAIFVAGGVLLLGAGFFAGFTLGRHDGAPTTAPGADSTGNTYLQRLVNDYHLRPDQVERIRGHLNAEQGKVDAVLEGVAEQVKEPIRAARAQTVDAIRGELDPEQRTRFDEDRKRGS